MSSAETDRAAVRAAITYLATVGATVHAEAVKTLADARNVLALTLDGVNTHRERLADEAKALRELIARACESADREPGDAQRALRELRDAAAPIAENRTTA